MRRDKKQQKKQSKRKNKPSSRPGKPKKSTRKAPSTPNGKLIQDLMDKRKVKGNYKDYVLIVGQRLIDWLDSWDAYNSSGEPVGHEGVILLHKRVLGEYVDERFAAKFWNKKLGCRIPPTQKERNPDAVRQTTD